MKTFPWLTGLALLFWGWQMGYAWVGLLAAALLEGGRLARWHWNLSNTDYRRIWDFCSAVFVFLAVFFYSSRDMLSASHAFLLWLPLVFLPIAAAQWFGPLEKIDYRVFWLWLRFKARAHLSVGAIGIAPLYFAICLFATTAINMNHPAAGWFYAGFGLVSAAALWRIRPRHYPAGVWIVAIALAGGVGFAGHHGLRQLQDAAEKAFNNWLSSRMGGEIGASESRTALGQIGKIHLSGRILWRVETQPGRPTPDLLRQASYNSYGKEVWYSRQKNFTSAIEELADAWTLSTNAPSAGTVTIAGYLPKGEGLLPLPIGIARIDKLPSQQLEYNPLGAVRAKQAPAFVQYQAGFVRQSTIDSPPMDEDDLKVPEAEQPALKQIADQLQLDPGKPEEALKTVTRFFLENFRYTMYLGTAKEQAKDLTPLADFLLRKRAGHCEYFATATVLLLRQAGIPARYAVGYAMHESSGMNKFVVRERHGHAWCLVYRSDKKTWIDYDTTPDSWFAIESQNASFTQSISDFFSWLWFKFSQWRYGAASVRNYVLVALAITIVLLGIQIIFQRRGKKAAAKSLVSSQHHWPGGDSEFYAIEQYLAGAGWQRAANETPRQWHSRLGQLAARVAIHGASPELIATLNPILRLHYRHRFDPEGLPPGDRQRLREETLAWLEAAKRYKTTAAS